MNRRSYIDETKNIKSTSFAKNTRMDDDAFDF